MLTFLCVVSMLSVMPVRVSSAGRLLGRHYCTQIAQDGVTALMRAAQTSQTDCVRLLVEAGAKKLISDTVRISKTLSYLYPHAFERLTIFHCDDASVPEYVSDGPN